MPIKKKQCRKCGKNRPDNGAYFSVHDTYSGISPPRLRNICRLCDAKERQERRQRSPIGKSEIKDEKIPDIAIENIIEAHNLNGQEWEANRLSARSGTLSVGFKRRGQPPLQITTYEGVFPKFPGAPSRVKKPIRKALVLGDAQCGYNRYTEPLMVPFHDERALRIVLSVAQKHDFDDVIVLGDMLDCSEWTDKFIPNPRAVDTFNHATRFLYSYLRNLREACPDARIAYIEGNHEARVERMFRKHLRPAWGVQAVNDHEAIYSIARLLDLESLGITYHGPWPDGEVWLNENLRISHGYLYSTKSGESCRKILEHDKLSQCVGHIHRVERVSVTTHRYSGPVVYTAASFGTLALIDGEAPRHYKNNNWQNGFGVVEYESGNGGFQICPVEIYNGECIYDGTKYFGGGNLTKSKI